MKKILVLFSSILLFICSQSVFGDMTGNGGVSTLLSSNFKSENGNNIKVPLYALPIFYTSIFLGLGNDWELKQNTIYLGIYGDIHMGFLSYLFDIKDDEYENRFPLFFQSGIRLQSKFINELLLYVQPFIGLNLIGVLGKDSAVEGYKMIGFRVGYNKIGIEYSYQTLLLQPINDTSCVMHRIAIVFSK